MPLLPVEELENISPLFKGKIGNALLSAIRKLLSISDLSDLYDEISSFRGADFAHEMLHRLGIRPEIGNPDRLLDLPKGPFITISNLWRDRRDYPAGHDRSPEAVVQGDGQRVSCLGRTIEIILDNREPEE